VLFGGYLIVGGLCAVANLLLFIALTAIVPAPTAAPIAFALAAFLNYWLCVTFLFRHSAKWATAGEVAVYLLVVVVAGGIDWGATLVLIRSGLAPVAAKLWASAIALVANFLGRRFLVFPEPRPGGWAPAGPR
jgi:dolichol-phosphate mannosyltransferase